VRGIICWSLADHLRSGLVVDALGQAIGSRDATQRPIFRSDGGSLYGSAAFREIPRRGGIRRSMSARDYQSPARSEAAIGGDGEMDAEA
jgi:putative transposase